MGYIIKNSAINALYDIHKEEVGKSKNAFFHESKSDKLGLSVNVLNDFKLRTRFEKIIDESISFNKKLMWNGIDKNIGLADTAEKLIDVFKLRSEVYASLNYNSEFPDEIEGMNYDDYDLNSAIIYNKTNSVITGTCRIIVDSPRKLPIDEKISLDFIREKFNNIGEVSRVVSKLNDGLNLDFKNLVKGIYIMLTSNNLDGNVSVMTMNHFRLYERLGGITIEKEMEKYGNINAPFVITSWDTTQITPFFKKVILR